MPYILDCKINTHQEVARDHCRMVIHCPEIAAEAEPGQFVMLQVQEGMYPFLRRPMSIERIFKDSISILYKIEGEGTRLLSKLSGGQTINVQGPLGNGFSIEPDYTRHILVAGGIGVAPFPALADAIELKLARKPEVILAARTEDFLLCEKDFHRMGCPIHLATDDGTAGEQAFASQVLERLAPGPDTVVYACGPMVMMKATHQVCDALGIRCYASLEAEMACGDGVCLGCVVETTHENEAERMVRVCKDGPVFDSQEINWSKF